MSELRTQKKAAPRPWKVRQRHGTDTLVISNLLILAAPNVLFPYRSLVDHSWLAETETRVIVAAKNRACRSG